MNEHKMKKRNLNQHGHHQGSMWQVVILACAAFVFNTTEFIPVALLSDIGKGFSMAVADVGWMMTLYAWTVSILSLPMMLLTAKWERRRLLLAVLLVFVAGHVVSVLAWRFEVLLSARLIVALAHAVFWSITAALVVRLAPVGKETSALGYLSMGSALAMILGLPLGRILGQMFDWRTTFGIIGVLAVMLMFLLWKTLPKLPSQNSGNLKSLPLLLHRPRLLLMYVLTFIAITAHFTVYSYIEPFLLQISKMSESWATMALLVFGVAGLVAGALFGRFYRRWPHGFVLSALCLLALSLLLLLPLAEHDAALFVLIFVWGMAEGGLALSLMMRVLQYAADATDVATAIYSGIFNIGIGGGALLGGVVMRQLGLAHIAWCGAILAVLGGLVFVMGQRRYGEPQQAGL